MQVWRDELGELAAFYRQHHRPENVAILTGDFNMSGTDSKAGGRDYLQLFTQAKAISEVV